MADTVPNQNILIIKKTPCTKNFLQISNEELAAAAIDFGKSFNAFKMYLYFAGNEIGYNKAVSFVDFANKFQVKRSSYHECWNLLVEKGYIVQVGANKFEFYTTPKKAEDKSRNEQKSAVADNSADSLESALADNVAKKQESALAELGRNEQASAVADDVAEKQASAGVDKVSDLLKEWGF